MSKRITYLGRRADRSAAAFSAHWAGPHSAIARDLPGVAAYRQHHVVVGERRIHGVDGIVELWFDSDADAAAGYGSAVADRLVDDEPRFLSALTGGPVDHAAERPTPAVASVWLLADAEGASELTTLTSHEALRAARTCERNTFATTGPLLVRDALMRFDPLPIHAVSYGFADVDTALAVRDALATVAPAGVDVLAAHVTVVI